MMVEAEPFEADNSDRAGRADCTATSGTVSLGLSDLLATARRRAEHLDKHGSLSRLLYEVLSKRFQRVFDGSYFIIVRLEEIHVRRNQVRFISAISNRSGATLDTWFLYVATCLQRFPRPVDQGPLPRKRHDRIGPREPPSDTEMRRLQVRDQAQIDRKIE